MGIYYKDNNKEGPKALFSKTVLYNKTLRSFSANGNAVVDFNQGEKFLYGRVTPFFIPMAVTKLVSSTNPRGARLPQALKSNLLPVSPYDASILSRAPRALEFVARAFQDLSMHFKAAAAKGQIRQDDPHLGSLVARRAFIDPRELYDTYINEYFAGVASVFRQPNVRITNFEDFLDNLRPAIRQSAVLTPFTYPAFLKSRRCPINVSGLAIEIASLDATNDQQKISDFVNSPNWQFYLNACRNYGFMVDKSMPWRLVADIGSSPMMRYAAAFMGGIAQTEMVLRNYYGLPAATYYNDHFGTQLTTLYDRCITRTIESENCTSGLRVRDVTPVALGGGAPPIAAAELARLYLEIRNWEEEVPLSKNEFQLLVADTLSLSKTSSGWTGALNAFETIINKPFDYRGSKTYNNTMYVPASNKYYRDLQAEESAGKERLLDSGPGGSSTMGGGGGY